MSVKIFKKCREFRVGPFLVVLNALHASQKYYVSGLYLVGSHGELRTIIERQKNA